MLSVVIILEWTILGLYILDCYPFDAFDLLLYWLPCMCCINYHIFKGGKKDLEQKEKKVDGTYLCMAMENSSCLRSSIIIYPSIDASTHQIIIYITSPTSHHRSGKQSRGGRCGSDGVQQAVVRWGRSCGAWGRWTSGYGHPRVRATSSRHPVSDGDD